MTHVVTANDFSQRSTLHATLVWGLSALFYFYELMLLVSPSVMLDDLAYTFKTSAEQLGSLAAYYYYAYALMQIPVGLLMDRFGPRILLTIAALLCAVGSFVFGYAPSLEIAQLGRFVMGVGGAFAVVGCLKLASIWFPVSRFALLTGIMVAVGMMGGVFGQAPVAKLVMAFGWRNTAIWGGIVGALLSVILWMVITNNPFKKLSNTYVETRYPRVPFLEGLVTVMKSPQVWLASLYAGLMFVPTTGFGQLWGVPYFVERYHIGKDAAGFMVSMIFFGWAIGGPLYGWISDRILRRKSPMVFAAISTLIVMSAILYAPANAWQMKILMFLLGACSSGFILAFSIVREINAPWLTGTAIGFINTLNNISGAFAQPVVGRLLDKQWDGQITSNGDPFYSHLMYTDAFLFLPVCIFLALVILPMIRETYGRTQTS
jgi:MFS family permease